MAAESSAHAVPTDSPQKQSDPSAIFFSRLFPISSRKPSTVALLSIGEAISPSPVPTDVDFPSSVIPTSIPSRLVAKKSEENSFPPTKQEIVPPVGASPSEVAPAQRSPEQHLPVQDNSLPSISSSTPELEATITSPINVEISTQASAAPLLSGTSTSSPATDHTSVEISSSSLSPTTLPSMPPSLPAETRPTTCATPPSAPSGASDAALAPVAGTPSPPIPPAAPPPPLFQSFKAATTTRQLIRWYRKFVRQIREQLPTAQLTDLEARFAALGLESTAFWMLRRVIWASEVYAKRRPDDAKSFPDHWPSITRAATIASYVWGVASAEGAGGSADSVPEELISLLGDWSSVPADSAHRVVLEQKLKAVDDKCAGFLEKRRKSRISARIQAYGEAPEAEKLLAAEKRVAAQMKEVEKRERKLKAKEEAQEKRLHERKRTVEEEVREKETSIRAREDKLRRREEEFTKKEQQWASYSTKEKARLKQEKERLEAMQASFDRSVKTLHEERRTFEEEIRAERKRQDELKRKAEELTKREDTVMAREGALQQREAALSKRGEAIKQKEADLERREEALKQREQDLSRREEALKQKEQELVKAAEDQKRQYEAEQRQREAELAQRDKALQQREQALQERATAPARDSASAEALNEAWKQIQAEREKLNRELEWLQRARAQLEESKRSSLSQESPTKRQRLLEQFRSLRSIVDSLGYSLNIEELSTQPQTTMYTMTTPAFI